MADEESRIIDMLEYKSKCIKTIDEKWITEWATLIDKYFKCETRNHIRLKAIALLSQIFSKYHVICEDELMNRIVLPNFNDVDQENDSVVRKPIVHLLFDIASACLSYKHCNAILAIIRKVLNKPFKQKCEETNGLVYIIGNVDIIDSRLIISNINKLFKVKLYRLPIDPAVNMLDIAVNYLNLTYKCPLQDPTPAEIPMIRRELFSLFLNLRCNKHGHLGVLTTTYNNNNHNQTQKELIRYSPFIICVKRPKTTMQSSSSNDQNIQPITQASPMQQQPPPDSPTLVNSLNNQFHSINPPNQQQHNNNNNYYQQNIFVPNASQPNCPIVSRCVNLYGMFAGIIECINHESDLDVLKLVLDGLPGLLANKPLVLAATEERINQLCLALSELIRSNKTACRQQQQQQHQNYRFDIIKCGLRCLTTLLIYRKYLDFKSIKVMLAAFEDSLKISHHQPIVPLFTTCLIELQDSSEMTRFLPVVLNRLSKFSPTLNLGISMLEFLSYLILFPKLYENFSEDEYKFIFAIALPYTNPFRFSDYITCLAFRVLAMWYLNCRPSLRCAFVELVKKSLQSNVIQPFKENSTIYSHHQQHQHHQQHHHHQQHQSSSPSITQTPPITYSCPINMSPVDQRKRSSSLNTENSFKSQQAAALCLTNQQSLSLQVNEELIETYADLLSRYTHGQCLAIAPKNKCIELLVDRNTSQTWLHGNSLVTITSGQSSHGWAEIMIRRPTGNTSWVGRLQNTVGTLPMCLNQQVYLDSLNFGNDVISLFSAMTFTDDCNTNSGNSNNNNTNCNTHDTSNNNNQHHHDSTASSSSNIVLSPTTQPTISSSLISLSSSVVATPQQQSSSSSASGILSGSGLIPASINLASGVLNNTSGGNNNNIIINSPLSSASSSTLASSSATATTATNFQPLQYTPKSLRNPIPLPKDKKFDVAISVFDHITPYETHKIGVIYVSKNQTENRAAILANKCGSSRYYEFLQNIGTCIILNDIDPEIYFIGGLDAKGADGKYAYFWKDNLTQVIFHVATCMPAREGDLQCNNKNRHIGNDHVCIVYNDSKQPFQMSTIKGTGQIIMACIVITPSEDEITNLVEVEVLPELKYILGEIEPKVLSNLGAPLYARQLAIHLNLASKIYERRQCEGFFNNEPYVSNWIERLRCIKRIRQRLEDVRKANANSNSNSLK